MTVQLLSFVIPAALLIYRRRSEKYLPRNRAFPLPNWLGWTVNLWTMLGGVLVCVFFFLPPFLPVTGSNMSTRTLASGSKHRTDASLRLQLRGAGSGGPHRRGQLVLARAQPLPGTSYRLSRVRPGVAVGVRHGAARNSGWRDERGLGGSELTTARNSGQTSPQGHWV